jgi:hypothetical protein
VIPDAIARMPVAGLPRCRLASCRFLEIPMENKDKAAPIDCKIIKKAIFILLMNKKHANGIGPFFNSGHSEQK